MASFYGLEIAKTGLFYSQRGLNLTGHNISNVNTPGYTRQRFIAESIDPASTLSRYAPTGIGKVGGGVRVQSLDQIRNSFIDREIRRENAAYGMLTNKEDTLIYIETIFNETAKSSLSSTLADFFNSIHALSQDAASKEMRSNMRQNALKLADSFQHYYKQLYELQKVQNDSMKVVTDNINDILESVADYNKQIYVYELSGEKANDLKDKRNLLLDELSKLINIEYSEDELGRLTVTCGGDELVNHTKYNKLVAIGDKTCPVTEMTGLYTIYIEGSPNKPLQYSSGELQAYKDLRDGNAANDIGIPRMIDNLNTLARTIAKEFNAIHAEGYSMPHDGIESEKGFNFFDVPGGDYDNVTAKNFTISADILNDVFKIAASSTKVVLADGNQQKGNNEIALAMVALASSEDVPGIGSFEAFLKDIIIEISVESAHVQKLAGSQTAVVNNLEQRRESISGVSLDEEIVQMMQFQHMYAAASRMITAIDEALDIVINRTGLVGRA